jgi:FtsH-binding integral membrane protein
LAAALAGLRLPNLALVLPKGYFIGRSALFGLMALGLGLGLFTGRFWAPPLTQWAGLIVVIWTLLERAIFSASEYAQRTIPATIIIALLIWSALVIALRRPTVREFFQEHPA